MASLSKCFVLFFPPQAILNTPLLIQRKKFLYHKSIDVATCALMASPIVDINCWLWFLLRMASTYSSK